MLALILITVGFLMRLVPHAANIAPVAAIALFAGAYLDRRIAPWIALIIMAITDLILGMHDMVLFTWGAFLLIGFLGMTLRERRTPGPIFGMTILSAVLFFLISNFGVWLLWYPRTSAGFLDCYVKALPFFRNTMVSNIVYAFAFFGIYEFVKRRVEGTELARVLI